MSLMTYAERLFERNASPDSLTRVGIRYLLRQRLIEESSTNVEDDLLHKQQMLSTLRSSPIAIHQEKANEQHYELPPQFFQLHLGSRRKYSCAYYEHPDMTLDEAEDSMLRLYCQRAKLKDGMTVLDLGCGWGSLTLYIAEHYPRCQIVGLSNSWAQRKYIEEIAKEKKFTNVTILTDDVTKVDRITGHGTFDRIFSIEMFEHMRNYEQLLRKISRWMHRDSRLFVHIFCHVKYIYSFETEGPTNWMGRHFFTGGIMPSSDVLLWFQDDVKVLESWLVDGRHYAQTAEHWVQNFDARVEQIRPILKATYGDEATKWEAYWRTFYMAVAELFGYSNGSEWMVAHYLLQKR